MYNKVTTKFRQTQYIRVTVLSALHAPSVCHKRLWNPAVIHLVATTWTKWDTVSPGFNPFWSRQNSRTFPELSTSVQFLYLTYQVLWCFLAIEKLHKTSALPLNILFTKTSAFHNNADFKQLLYDANVANGCWVFTFSFFHFFFVELICFFSIFSEGVSTWKFRNYNFEAAPRLKLFILWCSRSLLRKLLYWWRQHSNVKWLYSATESILV